MNKRAQLDRIAWETIHSRAPFTGAPSGLAKSNRPSNYRELGELMDQDGDFAFAWSEFLHEFYRYKTASFFAELPPTNLSPGYRAMLAGAAEYLSRRFDLPVPEWTDRPEFFLTEEWDILGEILPDVEQYREERRARADEAFLKRNVIFESRSLIAL